MQCAPDCLAYPKSGVPLLSAHVSLPRAGIPKALLLLLQFGHMILASSPDIQYACVTGIVVGTDEVKTFRIMTLESLSLADLARATSSSIVITRSEVSSVSHAELPSR